MALEKLQSPPIVEVVCGVLFEPIHGIDPLVLGSYWESRRAEYPKHQLHAPILDENVQYQFELFPPIRSWFVTDDDAWVLQIQWDRFYLNWRQQGGVYPRFSDQGADEGVLSRFLREFESFSKFAADAFRVTPSVKSYELAKIDLFVEGVSWDGFADLATMLPWMMPFAAASQSKYPNVTAKFREERDGANVMIGVDVGAVQTKLETRIVAPLVGELRTAFERSNAVVNDVFDKMIPREQRDKRFQGGEA